MSDDEFWDAAFLAAFPVALELSGWRYNNKPISDVHQRTDLAWRMANRAAWIRKQPREDYAKESTLYCSFCQKSQHEVKKLIAGPGVFICDECVDLCDEIIAAG